MPILDTERRDIVLNEYEVEYSAQENTPSSAKDILPLLFEKKTGKKPAEDQKFNEIFLGMLTDNERRALMLDPNIIRDRLRIDSGSGELFFDDISLQTKANGINVKVDRLPELKHSIGIAYRNHCLEKRAGLANLKDEALTKNRENLHDALGILDSCTHWYNSSDEYRNMNKALKALAETADQLSEENFKYEYNLQLRSRYQKDVKAAIESVETYLRHKNALDTNVTRFKNSYEADRVAAARSLLTTLKENRESFVMAIRVEEAEAKFDRYAKYLYEKHSIDKDELNRMKSTCCSPRRIKAHDAAKEKLNKIYSNAREAREDYKKATGKEMPAAYSSTISSYLTKGTNDQKFMHYLINMDSQESKAYLEEFFVHNVNKAGALKHEDFALDDYNTFTEATNKVINDPRTVVFAKGLGNTLNEMERTFGMSLKEEYKEGLMPAAKLGNAGFEMLELMADDNGFMLPLDEFTKIKPYDSLDNYKTNYYSIRDNKALTDEDKTSLNKFYSCVYNQNFILSREKDPAEHKYTMNDFDGAVEKQQGITRGEDVVAAGKIKDYVPNDVDLSFADGAINDVSVDSIDLKENVPAANRSAIDEHDIKMKDAITSKDANVNLRRDADKKPENLLNEYILTVTEDNDRREALMGVSKQIADARTRLAENSAAKNIYPEVVSDMKILLFAEHLKQEILLKEGLLKKDSPFMPEDTRALKVDSIINPDLAKPTDNFLKECERFTFGPGFRNLSAKAKDTTSPNAGKNAKETIIAMKEFAEGSGAHKVYASCAAQKNAEMQKQMEGRQINKQ